MALLVKYMPLVKKYNSVINMIIIRHVLLFQEKTISPEQEKAYKYYKKNSMSIEVLKDDYLQKVNFRVKNKVANLDFKRVKL